MTDWNTQIIEEFRANGGRVGGDMAGSPLVLLHHTGAKSGEERIAPLMYQQLEGDTVAIFASKAGAPEHPHWFANLRAHPETTIEIGDQTREVRARVADEAERDRIWSEQKRQWPQFAKYEETSQGRVIPVVILEPR